MNHPRRGDVFLVNVGRGAVGAEIKKSRPAIVISNDISNKYLTRYQVIPLTSKVDRVYPSEILVTIGRQTSKAMANQIQTADRERFIRFLGRISKEEMFHVNRVLKIQLDL